MKRYTLHQQVVVGTGADQHFEAQLIESDLGDWVRYEDVDGCRVCNCQEAIDAAWEMWACPAHGYKQYIMKDNQ